MLGEWQLKRIGLSLGILAAGFGAPSAFAQPVIQFLPRSVPELRIVLGHYGPSAAHAHRASLKTLLETKFLKATQGKISLRVVEELNLADDPLVCQDGLDALNEPKFSALTPERRSRLRYYYASRFGLPKFLYEQYELRAAQTASADLLVITTDAQFEVLAYQSNKVIVAEFPSEAGWALSDGGLTLFPHAEELADRVLHEIGHGLGLLHSAEHCEPVDPLQPGSMEASARCCEKSPSRNDLMSYCRNRSRPQFEFSSCTLKYLEESVVPVLLKGGEHVYQKEPCL